MLKLLEEPEAQLQNISFF